ncbi:polyketide synthase, partial [Myxococcota bacterium]|nr:polyketide synthase [Myxococcota bacterium]
MIKKILDSRLPVLVYNPTRTFDRAYFDAIAAAGALPVFDTEFFPLEERRSILGELAGAGYLFGLRIHVGDTELINTLRERHLPTLNLIVFSYRESRELEAFRFAGTEYRHVLEVTDMEINHLIDPVEPQGLIVRGFEAPGRNAKTTSFILMQWYLGNTERAVIVHGGVGWHTAAGLFAAGVSAVALDDQLWLTDECPLAPQYKETVSTLSENDSVEIGETLGAGYRFFAKLGTRIVKTLSQKESTLFGSPDAAALLYNEIASHMVPLSLAPESAVQSLFFCGQDGVFARHFVKKSTSVRDVLPEFYKNAGAMLSLVDRHDPLHRDSPLAREHGTALPIVQGPMANVSDSPAFAAQVHQAGALPFIAMGSLPAALIDPVLGRTKELIPAFGAGLIGIETFNKTIKNHLDLVKKHGVPLALFAGGIPSQVNELEALGIKTYLHTPAEKMLKNAIEQGNRRFILEGT